MSSEPVPTDQSPIPAYDRDAIIASMTRYYTLLSKAVGIKPTAIDRAPKKGCKEEHIPLEQMRLLGFNDRMIDFVRHATFVSGSDRPVYYGTQTLNYYRYLFSHEDEEYEGDAWEVGMWPIMEQRIAEGIVPLSRPFHDDPCGTWWLLDTSNGELTAHDAYLCRPEEEVPENEPWRTARPVPATAYFDGLHDDLMALRMVPLPGSPSHSEWDIWPTEGIWPDRQRWVDEAKEIYISCHWPTLEYFQRAKCRRLLTEMLERYWAWQREEWAKRPPPADYTDAEGRPISPPHVESEAGSRN